MDVRCLDADRGPNRPSGLEGGLVASRPGRRSARRRFGTVSQLRGWSLSAGLVPMILVLVAAPACAQPDAVRISPADLNIFPVLRPAVALNAELRKQHRAVVKQVQDVQQLREGLEKTTQTLSNDLERTRKMVDAVGLTNAIGLLLRRQRAMLPDVRRHRRNIRQRQSTIRTVQFQLLELDDKRSKLSDSDALAEQIIEQGEPANQEEFTRLRAAVHALLENRRNLLESLVHEHNTYFDALVRLDVAEQRLIDEAQRYSAYIDERVMWIRSDDPFDRDAFRAAASGLKNWLLSPRNWEDVTRVLETDVRHKPFVALLAVCLLGLMLFYRGRFHSLLRTAGEKTRRGRSVGFAPTAQALGMTTVLAAIVPAVLYYLAWRLSRAGEPSEFVKGVATGLSTTAAVLLPAELLRKSCRQGGLADAHFHWPPTALRMLNSRLRYGIWFGMPLVFVTAAAYELGQESGPDALGRLCFVAGMLLIAVILRQIVRPSGAVIQPVLTGNRGGWIDRLRYIWFPLCLLVPCTLAVLAVVGYYDTAYRLAFYLQSTAWLLISVLLLRSALLEWVLINRRRLAMQQARERRAAAAAERRDAEGTGEAAVIAEPEIDAATVSSQTQRLLNTVVAGVVIGGVWLIWIDVFPALGILKSVELRSSDPVVTLADLIVAILIAVVATIATRNIPGLLEIVVLQRLPLAAGIRYALVTVARYAIIITGIVLAFGAVGIGWDRVQWLAAAVTVGLGFGLQEIFANFVSGLILLFERPIRLGDVVTVGDVSGTVTKIRMRATTITNWDRKELIVPNKEFITGHLLNWTLSDRVNRVVVNVGVAYGSDTDRVRQLLLGIASDNPHVLHDPLPRVTFESFGDSTLDFVLRCYLPNLDNRLDVINALHCSINDDFNAAGIEIAFPQQDVHIRSFVAKQSDAAAIDPSGDDDDRP